jgi:hypothetical protein
MRELQAALSRWCDIDDGGPRGVQLHLIDCHRPLQREEKGAVTGNKVVRE